MEKELQIRMVKRAKMGDAQAFVRLCEAYQTVLYNSAYKLLLNNEDVADCLQETEIRAWQKITSLKNEAAFNSWIFKIMINIAKGIIKRRVESVEFEEKHLSREESRYEKPDLEQELNSLSEKYKIPLILHYYAGLSVKEIAAQERISVNTVKTRLARGRAKLKALLEVNNHG